MNKVLSPFYAARLLPVLILLLLAVVGCGGPSRPTATALPPDLARPQQSTPAFANRADRFSLEDVTPSPPRMTAPPGNGAQVKRRPTHIPVPIRLPMSQPPTALGIVRSPVGLQPEPGSPVIISLPAGATVTVTGRSRNGLLLAVFTSEGLSGWVPSASVTLFGADDLLTLDETVDMGAIATLIAEAMQPVELPTRSP